MKTSICERRGYTIVLPLDAQDERITAGSFSLIDHVYGRHVYANGFVYCREYFQDEACRVRRFLFSHRQNLGENVAQFIRRIERRLNFDEFSTLYTTNRRTVTMVRPNPWWMDTSMQKSLYTLLIRAGVHYDPEIDNFVSALFSIDYTGNTKYAIQRFLLGYTKYTGKVRGWVAQFWEGDGDWCEPKPPGPERVRELLVRPS